MDDKTYAVVVVIQGGTFRDRVKLDRRRENGQVGVRFLDGVEEHAEPVRVVRVEAVREVILVADTDKVELERLLVAQLRSFGAVLGGSVPREEFNLMEGILDVDIQLVFGGDDAF